VPTRIGITVHVTYPWHQRFMDKIIVSVSQAAVSQAERAIKGCSKCLPNAKLPFWRLLNSFRHYDEDQVEYIIPVLARCPNCQAQIGETTLVEPKWNAR
jgi:hypothetical protein